MNELRFIGVDSYGNTVQFNSEEYAEENGIKKYFELVSPIPEGSGRLRTDGISQVWWEAFPEYIPPEPLKPEPDKITLLEAKIQALSDQNEFLEDCIAEMAAEVYQ